jgi:hypothetical protein
MKLLNLVYDLTPADLIVLVITELGYVTHLQLPARLHSNCRHPPPTPPQTNELLSLPEVIFSLTLPSASPLSSPLLSLASLSLLSVSVCRYLPPSSVPVVIREYRKEVTL